LDRFLRVPWTLLKSFNHDEGYHVVRVKELPEVLATGRDDAELGAEFWNALRSALTSYLLDGEPIPMPAGYKEPRQQVQVVPASRVAREGDLWQPVTGAGGVALLSPTS